mmetsp:Transcript_3778/g.11053  ORF Transcript_3778/g.11053 Transcript_3778/m.11053 type:complete len:244 (-) Transcript_3778:475-1206(-)
MPRASISSAMSAATRASPSITGTIGHESWPAISKPASRMAPRKCRTWALRVSRSSEPALSMRKTSRDAPATEGARVFENRYGRPLFRSRSISNFGPVVYPPVAPPRALPRVLLMMSTRSSTPQSSGVPRPVAPRNPVAWHSSTKTCASYFFARAQISARGAMSPSIENTPSVMIMRCRVPLSTHSLRMDSRWFMSRWLYRKRCALQSRMPSMMDAWLSESEIAASSGPRHASKSPALASKQEG